MFGRFFLCFISILKTFFSDPKSDPMKINYKLLIDKADKIEFYPLFIRSKLSGVEFKYFAGTSICPKTGTLKNNSSGVLVLLTGILMNAWIKSGWTFICISMIVKFLILRLLSKVYKTSYRQRPCYRNI